MLRRVLIGLIFLQATGAYAYDHSVFAARRETLMKKIEGSLAVLKGAPEPRAYVPFRQENNFYYLTGLEAPDALLILDAVQGQTVLFLPPRNKEKELWEGPGFFAGAEARRETGIEEVLEVSRFGEELEKRMKTHGILYTPFAPEETAAVSRDRALKYDSERRNDLWDGRISARVAFINTLRARVDGITIKDLSPILDSMRRVKDAQEIERLRMAGRISALGLKEAMRSVKPGMYEYQAAAVAEFAFRWHNAQGFSFFPIVGSGPNSCFPHYHANKRRMEAGDMVVMDIGAEYQYYQSDVTRSFPVSGKFSREQARVYRAVLSAYKAALEKIRPGSTLKILKDTVKEVLGRYGYADYLTHGVSHYVGMSTHDVGEPEPFEPGVVIAVEPGVYIPERNLGIRIEDTVLVTRGGYEVLTGEVPKEIDEIEKLMAEAGFAERIAY